MRLFTRLIDSGVFIFWSEDESDVTFNLKIRIIVADERITLLDMNPSAGQCYYSFDRIGSGDYEIELNAFRNNLLYQTETKNIKIISSTQQLEEAMGNIQERIKNINSNIITVSTLLGSIDNGLNDPETIAKTQKDVSYWMRKL